MNTFYMALAGIHTLIAFLILVGYLITLWRRSEGVPALMVWPARLQLLLGLALVGLAEAALDMELNHAKVGVKLVVALAVVASLEIARSRAATARPYLALVHAAFALTVVNVLVAFFWN